jgi:hypothetical protein
MLVSRCRAILYADSKLGGASIHVYARNGDLYLRGEVNTEAERDRAGTLAARAEGVRGVHNEITLASERPAYAPIASPIRLGAPESTSKTTAATNHPSLAPSTDASAVPDPFLPQRFGERRLLADASGRATVVTYLVRRTPTTVASSAMATTPPEIDPFGWPLERQPVLFSQRVAKTVPPVEPSGGAELAFRSDVGGANREVRPVARFVIPPPPEGLTLSGPTPTHAPAAPARGAPAVLGAPEATRADVDAILRRDPGFAKVCYRCNGAEMVLSGAIRSASDLHELTAELSQLPGVDIVSWENLRFLD